MANFVPVKKFAKNINLTLDEFAKEREIERKELDFDIQKTTSYYQTDLESEPKEITDSNIGTVLSDKNIRSPKLILSQTYDILIKPLRREKEYYLNFSLAANSNKTKAVVTIKPDSILTPNSQTEAQIISQIRSKMAQMGFLIKLFDNMLHPNVRKALLTIKKTGSIGNNSKFIVAQSPDAIAPIDEKIIPHYEKEEKSYVSGVHAGDLVVEYIVPRNGQKGRSLRGIIIDETEAKLQYGEIVTDENFEEKTEKNRKLYFASNEGYVVQDENRFSIENSLNVEGVSFKSTGSIQTQKDQNVDLKISHDDHQEDAIGGGVKIDVASVDVAGSVGGNAEVNATNIDVGAQTHKNSVLEATESANVKLHRGNLKAKNATIGILETGLIEAEIANIEKTVGGEVRAKEVYIEELASNSIIIATDLIEIGYVSGEANKLYVAPNMVAEYEDRCDNIKNVIKEQKKDIRENEKSFSKKISEFKQSSERIKSFKKKFLDAQKAGKKPPTSVAIKLKQFQIESERIKEDANRIEKMKVELTQLDEKLEKELDAVFHAKVTLLKGSWNAKSEIIFIDPHNQKEYRYQPAGKERVIYLIKEGEDISVKYDY